MSWIKDLLMLLLFAGVLFGATLGRYPVEAPDGARYAEIPREMVVTGDYITPRLNGIKYFEKPPLFYWMQAVSIKYLGSNEFAVSIANALMAVGCLLLIYITTRKLYNRLSAVIAGLTFATTALVFALTRIVTLDMALTFFITGSMCSFLLATQLDEGWRRNLLILMIYVFAALAVMTKGLVGIIFPLATILIWVVLGWQWDKLKICYSTIFLAIFLIIVLPWHILVQIRNPEFFHFYFVKQHFLRYLTDYAGRAQAWWFFPTLLFFGFYPWVVFLPQTIFHTIKKYINEFGQDKISMFLLIWVVVVYGFYSFSQSKLIPYLLPIFPPLAILLGSYLALYWHTNEHKPVSFGFIALFVLNIILGLVAVYAIFNLDFSKQAITVENLFIVTICLLVSSALALILYRYFTLSWGVITLVAAFSCVWLYLNPMITTINKQSIKPLIVTLQSKLQPTDEVMCYGNYYQDLPFYLQRKITVANFSGELVFGMQQEDTKGWMIDHKTFLERWNSDRHAYLFVREDNYPQLKAAAPEKMRIVAKYLNNLLVVNAK